jgi:hypothetical protein
LPFDLSEAFASALESVYYRHFEPSDLVPEELFRAITKTLNSAVSDSLSEEFPDLAKLIYKNNEVFSAFKVHDQCSRMAGLLTDDQGHLKSFEQWRKEAEPIANHYNRVWLRTEYDTAVKRAEQARQWKQFEQESDVLPNLRWVPSTAVTPGTDHMVFWDTVLPIDDPFWGQHKPGDRWGCQCSLEATDEPATPIPSGTDRDNPAPGLDNNPAQDGKLFSDSHPYYPSSCSSCPFNTGDAAPFAPTNKVKDCASCIYLKDCLPTDYKPTYETIYVEGGKPIKISTLVKKTDSDYDDLVKIATEFSKNGFEVSMTPKMTRPTSFEYDCYYSDLRGTMYENKCPDFNINGEWYDYKGFTSENPKNALSNMLSKGLKQSDKLILQQSELTDGFILRRIYGRIKDGQNVSEIWLWNGNKLRCLYKKQEDNQN